MSSAKVGEFFEESRRRPINHGTAGGYRSHHRYDLPMCEPCRKAGALSKGRTPTSTPITPPRFMPMTASAKHPTALEPWRDDAACLGHELPPNTWDDDRPGDNGATRPLRIARAVHVCRTECPVRAECLAAVDLDNDEGVRGGMDLRVVRSARTKGRTA